MISKLKRLFIPSAAQPASKLTAQEAVRIAQEAAANDPLAGQLTMAKYSSYEGVEAWLVSSATIGQMLEVWVEDSSGNVLSVSTVGVR